MHDRLEAPSAMPKLVVGALAADQRADRLDGDVRRQQEELDCDELLRALLGGVGEQRDGR